MIRYSIRRRLFRMQKISVLRILSLVLVMGLFFMDVQPALAETTQNQAYVPLAASNVTPLLRHSDVIKTRDIELNKQLDITVALKLRNKDDLKQRISKARKAGVLGRVMSDQDLEDRFLPDKNAQDLVVNFLKTKGLKIVKTYKGHMAIQARGSAQEIEQAFNVSISYFAKNGNEFFANSTQPQLPAEISGLVECVTGLNNLQLKPASSLKNLASSLTTQAIPPYTPQEIQKAYNLSTAYTNNINGQGVNLAIATYYSFEQSDINYFLNHFGITGTKPIQVIPVDGTPTYDESGSGESTLDIESALSSAPGAQLMVYDGVDSYLTTGIDVFTNIVDDGKASVVSYSWGLDESSWETSQITAMDNLFAAGAAKGMTFLVASGDSGSSEISYPATDPYVTSVGGTTLKLNSSSGAISSEGSWGGSGGGSSALFSQPAWQQSVLKSSSGNRMFPDVSLNADPDTGYSVYIGGKWYQFGGTSAATPVWAAIFALVDQRRANIGLQPIGLANSELYSLVGTTVFHDITSGSNGDYQADRGYDMVTGLGSVDAWSLVKALSTSTENSNPTETLIINGPTSATANSPISIIVTAKDTLGNTTTGYSGTVHFTSTDGLAGLPDDYTFTSADYGSHTFNVTLKTAGMKNLTVTDTENSALKATSSDITVSSDVATRLELTAPATTTVNRAFNVTVTARDASGNIATGYRGKVHFTSTDMLASILPSTYYTFTSTDNGSHTFSVILKTVGTKVIALTDTGSSSLKITSGNITVSPAVVTKLNLTTPVTTTATKSFTVTVTATDDTGNNASGYRGKVHFTSTDTLVGLPKDYIFTSADRGKHVFRVTLKTAGMENLTVTDTENNSLSATSNDIAVSPGVAKTLELLTPTSATVNNSFIITVTAKDASGNDAEGYRGKVRFASTDSLALLPIAYYTFTSADMGSHTFNVTLKTVGTMKLSVISSLKTISSFLAVGQVQ